MRGEVFVAWVFVVAAAGCLTTTAHRLPIASNPLRPEAETCEQSCRSLLVVTARACGTGMDPKRWCDPSVPYVDRDPYAACLDTCPGATADEGQSCPQPPAPGVVCAETHKASRGALAAGVLAAITMVILVFAAKPSGGVGQFPSF
jgi:hypothetical protein